MTISTERLYFSDAYLRRFSARVVAHTEQNGRPVVALDQSAFYPEGGGQPADRGTLNGIAVLDVQSDAGVVWHMLVQPLDTVDVSGEIDWERRFDHMQQHHGQHLLSAAFEHRYGLRTVSFHLGAVIATIDLSTQALSEAQLAGAEDLVNQVIWEDHPVHARFVTAEELARLPLRKPPVVDGPVRVVSVPDFDYSACGGTHPRSTGGVGMVHIRRWERRGDTVRVEFICGNRVLRDLRWKNGALGRLAATLSVGAEEVETAITRLREAEERARKGLEAANERLVVYESHELLSGAEMVHGLPVVRRAFDGRSLEEVRGLARAIAEGGGVALLGLRGPKTQVIFARAEGLGVDCGALLRNALAAVGGRGGGQAGLAQGGLPDPARLDELLEVAISKLGM